MVEWLLDSAEPAIRRLARRELLDDAGDDADVLTGRIVQALLEGQQADGGFGPGARRSSFNETLGPIWGLHEYAAATGDADARAAARRGAELLLEHRIFRRLATGEPMHDEWLVMHWPPFWHYEILNAMVVLARLGLATDPRAADAVEVILERRQRDGRWHASSRWWKPPPMATRGGEAVDWRIDDSDDRMVTLRALAVLRAATSETGRQRMPVS